MQHTDTIDLIIRGVGQILPYGLVFLLLHGAFHIVSDVVTPYDDRKQRELGNTAATLNRYGAHLGFTIAISGSLFQREPTLLGDLGMFFLEGIVTLGVFVFAHYVLDFVILWKIDNSRAIEDGNMAVGFIEACGYVTLGLVICSSFTGGGQGLVEGQLSGILLSLVALFTVSALYVRFVFFRNKFTGCHIDREIAGGNMAAAVDAGSLLVATGVTLWFSLYGDSLGWVEDLVSYAIAATSSILILILVRMGIVGVRVVRGKVRRSEASLPRRGKHHANLARSMQLAALSIGAGLMAGLVTFI